MMDPVTTVGLVEGSISLAVQCGSVAKSLNSLAGQYKHAKLTVSTMVQNLDIMQLAWHRIGEWSKDYTSAEDDGFTQRLERFLETGSLVLDALEEDLQSYDISNMTFSQRSRLVWNENTLQGHQNRIRDQAQSMSLLLQAIQLPTAQATISLFHNEQSKKQFMKSDESAFSIVPSKKSSRLSLSSNQTDDHDSLRSYASMLYRRLSFEDDLFTARVYKRNYRSSRFRRLQKQEPDNHHECVNARKERRQSTLLGADLMALPFSKVLATVRTFSKGINNDAENLGPESCTVSTGFDVSTEQINQDQNHRSSSSEPDPYVELAQACGRGDIDRVKSLLRTRSEVSNLLFNRNSESLYLCPIYATVFNGNVEVMETLFGHAVSEWDNGRAFENPVCCTRPDRWPALHVATTKENLPMVQFLLRKGASVNARTEYGLQAIHLAAMVGSMEILATLIAAGADVNCADRDGRQPLHYILESQDRPDLIFYLIKRGAKLSGRHLHLARQNSFTGNIEILRALAALANESSLSLNNAIRHGSPSSLEVLGNQGGDPSAVPAAPSRCREPRIITSSTSSDEEWNWFPKPMKP